MSQVMSPKSSTNFLEHFEQLEGLLSTYGPSDLAQTRREAIRRFSEFGYPTTKDEEFKFTPLRWVEETAFTFAYGATVTRSELERLPLGDLNASTVVLVNGQVAPELETLRALPDGVFFGSLADAFDAIPDEVASHLGKIATLSGKLGTTNDERFVDLNTAFVGEGTVLFVPKGVALEHPIHIVHVTKADHGALVAHPRTLIILGENAEAKVVESVLSLEGTGFVNAVTEVYLDRYARLEHITNQDQNLESAFVSNHAVHQDANSVYQAFSAAFGSRLARLDLNVWIAGERTETWLNGMYVGKGNQVIDHHTRIDHAQPNCNSFEIYKGILDDQSQGVFNGKIFVYEDAQKTDAKQTNQAILLSPTATIHTKPQLEIFADDVKCTHGATIGQLREDALFYLQARGIPKNEARSILVYAFAAEVLEKITIDEVRERLEKRLFEKLKLA